MHSGKTKLTLALLPELIPDYNNPPTWNPFYSVTMPRKLSWLEIHSIRDPCPAQSPNHSWSNFFITLVERQVLWTTSVYKMDPGSLKLEFQLLVWSMFCHSRLDLETNLKLKTRNRRRWASNKMSHSYSG